MYLISKVKIWSWAKYTALFSALGMLLSLPISLIFGGLFRSENFENSDAFPTVILFYLIATVAIGLIGMGLGALTAVVYNWLVPHLGSIEIDIALEQEEK